MAIDPKATRDYFDGRAGVYYETNYLAPRTRHAFNLAMRREVCLGLVPATARRVLDLGCGPGAMAVPLAAAGKEVVALDLSAAMVRQARSLVARLAGRDVRCAVASAVQLPFSDGVFDAVVTTGVLEYVDDVAAALGEARRVLAPGGTLVATMTLPRTSERAAARLLARLRGARVPGQQICTRARFDALVEAAGLRIDERRVSYYAPFPLDVLLPRAVPLIDRYFGRVLERVERAKDAAKTYVVRAVREPG